MKKMNIPLIGSLLLLSLVVCPILYFKLGPTLNELQIETLKTIGVIAGCSAFLCFVIGEITRNNSQVDKIWSILPFVYCWVIAVKGGMHPRLVVMAVLATLWGIRLTFNFARKGAYKLKFWEGEEDYRWQVLRSTAPFNNKGVWLVFDLFFISIYQNALILMLTFPALVCMNSPVPFRWIDAVAAVLMLGFIVYETVADEQQWKFQSKKWAMIKAGKKLEELPIPYNKGFNTIGLWGVSRHPNYLAEQSIWVSLYLFTIGAGIGIINWSMIGALLLIVLFLGSTSLAEEISSGKYPEYADYCKKVNKYIPVKKHLLLIVMALMMPWFPAFGQFHHPDDFRERYTLKQVVVLSRHNIRSPLSGRSSSLQRITPHEWYHWSSAPGELSLRGGVLETMMGQFFRKWLVSEGLIQENDIEVGFDFRFYANSMQRTIATAQYFSSGMLPVANVPIWHLYEVGTMDPVFTPQITDDNEAFKALARQQIAAMGGEKGLVGIGERMADNYKVLERVLDMEQSLACREGDTCHYRTDDVQVRLVKNHEPGIGGSLRLACRAADALVLQYYEEPDALKAAFGDTLSIEDWERISEIKDWYGDVLFTAPSVARQAANPLLRTMLTELDLAGRKFTFLCGHDSNIGSVLAALEAEDYCLPNTIEKKTPIGCKLVIEKWEDHEGQAFAALNLVYQSTEQMRNMSILDLENPPMKQPVRLKGLSANEDGLYPYKALVQRFVEACLFAEGYAPLPYRIYRSYKAESMTGALPLVVFLHGAGERGNDNGAQLTHCIHYFLDDTVTERYPFLLMVPQCPAGKRWVNTDWSLPEHQMESEPTEELMGVIHLVDSLIQCGTVDSSRVYLCGISMGGFGVWDALQRWPDKFAAAIPICGGGDQSYAMRLKDTPVFIFHGLQDHIVRPSRSIDMYNALKTAGSEKAHLVTYPNLSHGCWDEAFSTPGLFHWLFTDSRNTRE